MQKDNKAYTTYLVLQFFEAAFFWTVMSIDMIYYVEIGQLDPLQLVLVGTTLELSILLFEVPTGIVADLFSRRLSTIIGFFLIGIGFIVQGIWAFFIPILIAQLLWGTGYTFTSGAVEAWITDEIGEEHAGQAFLHGAQRRQLGNILGIILGTILGMLNLHLPNLVGGTLFIFLAFYLIRNMGEYNFKPAPRESRNTLGNMVATFKSGLGMMRVRPVLIAILAIGFFYGFYSEGYDRLWIPLMLDQFTFPLVSSVVWFGGIHMVEAGLSAFFLSRVKKHLNFRTNRALITVLLLASIGLFLALIFFALAGRLWLAILLVWVIGILRNIIGPLHTTWVNQKLDPQVRATVISMTGQVDAIGQIAGGPGVGVIAQRRSISTGVLTTAFLLTPVLGLLFWQRVKNHEE